MRALSPQNTRSFLGRVFDFGLGLGLGLGLGEFFAEDFLDGGGVGFAFGFLHDLADEKAEDFFFAVFEIVLGFGGSWFGEDGVDYLFERAKVVFLDETELFGDGGGAAVFHLGVKEAKEDFLGGGGAELAFLVHGGEVF